VGALVFQQPLANGQYTSSTLHVPPEIGDMSHHYHAHPHHTYRLPKVNFPKFDGSHPKVWKEKCEKYFNMYHVLVHLWAEFSTIHFKGPTALWLQTYEAQHHVDSWVELCVAVESKFGKDLYHKSMHELLHIRQTLMCKNTMIGFRLSCSKCLFIIVPCMMFSLLASSYKV